MPGYLLFWISPVITAILMQRTEVHGLMWASFTFEPVNENLRYLIVSHGWWFWVNAAYAYTVLIWGGMMIIIHSIRSMSLYRQQGMWLLLGTAIPFVSNVLYISQLLPDFKKDFSPLAFATSGIAFAVGIFRYRLFDIMPIARASIIENMQEGVIVLDQERRIVDINPAARKILANEHAKVTGTPLDIHLPEAAILSIEENAQSLSSEISVQRNGTTIHFETKFSVLQNKKNTITGYFLILHDITERNKLYQQITEVAAKDSLTDLYNRRHFSELAENEIARSERYGHAISLLIIDVDYFKQINDSFGHLVGDQILQELSHNFKKLFRSVDIIGRYGGDEFVAVLPETPKELACAAASRLCETIAQEVFQTSAGDVRFSLSIGVSGEMKVSHGITLDALLNRADNALYLAKSRGRNQAALEDDTSIS